MDAAGQIEARAEEKVKAWRQSPNDTKTLKRELLHQIREETFNSAVLMRLLTEILIADANIVEALAAFDTYVTNQKLQLLKARSGAHANADSAEGTQFIFELVLTTLEGEAVFAHPRIEKLRSQLEDLCNESFGDKERSAIFAGIFARVALWQALAAVDDNAHLKYINEARAQFAKYDATTELPEGNSKVETSYAKGLFLALTAGPVEAFNTLKAILTECPDHLRVALLFIQILSAQDKLEQALQITEIYLNKDLKPSHLLDRMALIELKKTHIALLELVRGPDVALNELPEFVELVGFLFRAPSELETVNGGNSTKQVNGSQPKGRIFSFRRRETMESIASSTSTPVRERSAREVNAYERGIVGAAWFWIAQQYARAGLEGEAREAVDEARKFESAGMELLYTAIMQTTLGQLESHTNPQRALRHYLLALDADPLHVPAAIGVAVLTCRSSSLSEGDKEQARNALSILEASCTRYPGRYVPEAWYARGILYEFLGGREDARDMYWKTVELEERRGVTRYVFLDATIKT